MLKRIILFLLFICFLSGCRERILIDGFDSQEWKEDKLGCKGNRDKMVRFLMDQKELILGLTEADILKTFGRPDFQELSKRNQKFYFYYVLPGNQCKDALSGVKDQTFQIRLNSLGFANEIILNKL